MPDAKIYSFEQAQKAKATRMKMRGEQQQFHPSQGGLFQSAKEFIDQELQKRGMTGGEDEENE
jgi:hypothetical protein